MVTMKHIANRAGVSISTVSLVLNGRDAGRVSPEVAERIRGIAESLGYRTNRLASSLRTSRSRIIAFLSDEVATTPFAGRMIEGAQDAARALGYLLITVGISGGAKSPGSDREIMALKQYGTDGFIYARMFNQRTLLPQPLSDCKVVVADATDAAPSIVPDEHSIGFKATSHLLDAGCRRIAYVGTIHNMIAQPGRISGYMDALSSRNIAFDPELMINVESGSDEAARIPAFFDRHPDVDGFFCFNDTRAWSIYTEAIRRGLAIGKDIAVVGVDNHQVIAEALDPPLSTVELPHYEMGYWAVGKLVSMIEDMTVSPFPKEGYPIDRVPLPSLEEHSAKLDCKLRIKQSWVRPPQRT
ncbi:MULTISPECIES: LacI family DNA-binding transcriptional regulator [Bifidobacterium]|uniref:LacI family DNA-binding transcriptional regulator n=1 Tax=Bifidobacterium miconis TaxID=2834435 RepID=A0ABS6WI09_9BIFI|nr:MULTISPECIES: LacI family DNA-binding transcriptional regulator [Bifidobacterium]MBT1163313.1 LacI family DNA-binding transcriptional regulator [Bifidobacterium felsineum]MBW3093686.1 LacI family DNA-binding transcriptional regulator [Bifidobacterium miconis]